MIKKKVSVLVYLHNNFNTIDACLNSIFDKSGDIEKEVIVIDDGSTDGSRELLKRFHNISAVRHEFLGIVKSVNLQLDNIGDNDLVRISGDVIIKSDNWLERLQSTAYKSEETGIVGARLLFADDTIETDGRIFISGLGYAENHVNLNAFNPNSNSSKTVETDSVSSSLCYYKNETIKKNGLFDENYFPLYTEDDDYCITSRKNGYSVVTDTSVQAYHFISAKSPSAEVLPESGQNFESVLLGGKRLIQNEHFKYWKNKWGWDPAYPDLHLIRELYGGTKICWSIGERLKFGVTEEYPSVDVCVVTMNNLKLLKRMMDSLAETDYPSEKIKVYVTDNGSRDGTIEYLKGLSTGFPFEVYNDFLPVNSGVSYGLNLAVVKGSGDLVARLDDDIVLPSEWLKELVKVIQKRPYCGMAGPKILNDNEGRTIQCSDFRIYPNYNAHENEIDNGQADYISRTTHIKGCCNLYRRDVFNNCGLFDIRYSPSQFDDPDHQIKLLQRGYEIIYNGRVGVVHKLNSGVNASSAGISNMQANQQKLYGKWGGDVFVILDKALEESLEGRYIDLEKPMRPGGKHTFEKGNFSYNAEFLKASEGVINFNAVNKNDLETYIVSLLNWVLPLFKSANMAAPLRHLHSILNLKPYFIQTYLLLYIAYYRLGEIEKAGHFKELLRMLSEKEISKLGDQLDSENNEELRETFSQFTRLLAKHPLEKIIEHLVLENSVEKAEFVFQLLSVKGTEARRPAEVLIG